MSTSCPIDELTSTICNALQSLNHLRKANFLLDTSLGLIEAGKCFSFSCRINPSLQLAQVRSGSRELPRSIPEDPRSAKAGCCEGTPSSRECEEASRGTVVGASRPRSVAQHMCLSNNCSSHRRFPSCVKTGAFEQGNTKGVETSESGMPLNTFI